MRSKLEFANRIYSKRGPSAAVRSLAAVFFGSVVSTGGSSGDSLSMDLTQSQHKNRLFFFLARMPIYSQ
jgi:hypothetical protein